MIGGALLGGGLRVLAYPISIPMGGLIVAGGLLWGYHKISVSSSVRHAVESMVTKAELEAEKAKAEALRLELADAAKAKADLESDKQAIAGSNEIFQRRLNELMAINVGLEKDNENKPIPKREVPPMDTSNKQCAPFVADDKFLRGMRNN